MASYNFTNKVILITGASSGIGAGTAEYLATFNAKLALSGRNESNLNHVCEKCFNISGGLRPLAIVADVDIDVKIIIEKTIKHFGRLDVLINNAAIMEIGNLEQSSMEQYDRLMKTNVRAVFKLTKLSVPHLITSKGNIINISSIAGTRANGNAIVYSMSKAILDQFTRCLSLDLAAKGVRVNSINPGTIKTNLQRRFAPDDESYQKLLERGITTHPLGRIGTVQEIATVIAFLASDEHSGFMTGAIIPVDGGKHNACPR